MVNEAIDTYGARPLDCGPGVVLRRAETAEDLVIMLVRLELWEQPKVVITTRHKDREPIGKLADWNLA